MPLSSVPMEAPLTIDDPSPPAAPSPIELVALVERCRQGDALAWEGLVRRMEGRLYALALHYMRDPEDARDATQDVFVKLYRQLPKLDDDAIFLPWLLRLARNCFVDRLRRRRVRTPPRPVAIDEAEELVDPAPSPEERWFGSARRGLLHRALGLISEKGREALVLKDVQGLALEEVGTILAVPIGTVKSRVSRARLELARVVRTLDPGFGG